MKKTMFVYGLYVLVAGAVLAAHQFMYVLPLHLVAFFVAITGVVLSDLHAGWWLVKGTMRLPRRRLEWLHHIVGVSLAAAVVSGALMAWPVWQFLITDLSFQIKLGLVGALILNSVFIGRHVALASEYTWCELRWSERIPLLVSGSVSTIAWVGTFTAAQFLPL